MKRIIKTIFGITLFVLIIVYYKPIVSFTKKLIYAHSSIVIESPNEYFRDLNYNFVKLESDYIPYQKEDLYNIIYSVLDNGWKTFTFYCPSEYVNCINDVELISKDENILTTINNYVTPFNSFENISTTYDNNGKVTFVVTKLYTINEINEINAKIDQIINENITDDMSTEQKVKTIHDYIIKNTKYDTNYQNKTSEYNSATAYGPLIQGYAVCSGYADAMALFLNRFNINNFKVASTNHVWNAVYLNDTWVHLDLTWDDPVSEEKDYLLYEYYLIPTSKIKEETSDHNFNLELYSELN